LTSGVWTIVGRELHEQARRPWTFWLRVCFALIAVGIFALTAGWIALQGVGDQVLGILLFHNLQVALFPVIWLVVPFLLMLVPSMFRFPPWWPGTTDILIQLLTVLVLAQILAACGQLYLLQGKMARREFRTLPA
jgi:hypothetical protein